MKLNVVIPCRNEKGNIEECVEAIFNADLPNECSILVHVVDGMSDDGTIDIIHNLTKRYPYLKLIENKFQLTPYAFNLGIKAGGKVDFVQIIGARQILSKNYFVEAIKNFQEDNSTWCVGGIVNNVYLNSKAEIIANAMSTTFGMGLGNFRTLSKSGFVDTVGTPMYPYAVFDEIGFFDENLIRNQDDDYNYRVTSAGGKIFFNSQISVKYYVRATFKGLWRQFFQYGYWKVFVNKKHQAITTIRQLVPPLFVFYLMLLCFTPFFGKTLFLIALIPFVLYLLMSLLFSLKLAKNIGQFFLTLVTFPVLHISYGLGYLNGMLEFLILNKKPADSQKRLSR